MNWRNKSKVTKVVEALPFSSAIYYLLQRYITRSIPRSPASIESVVAYEKSHLAAFRRFTGREMPKQVFEFGAGWDLCSAVVRKSLGVKMQLMVDLHPLASAWQINHVIEHLGGDPLLNLALLDEFGITYRAPFDARDTGLVDGSVDLLVSTNTMEHIPPGDLRDILVECRRILAPQGIASFFIDYSDHYSHGDSSIGPHNFLRFSEPEWVRHNHRNHFQSRLRHRDYTEMIQSAGFRIALNEPCAPDTVNLPPLAPQFTGYSLDELAPTSGHFVLQRH